MSGSATDNREHLPAVVTTPAPATTETPPPTPTIPDDPDDRALFDARAEMEAADALARAGDGTPTPTPAPRARQTQPAPRQPTPATVPAGVLAEERRRSRALADENLYLKGALAARTAAPPPGANTPQPGGGQQQPTIAQRIQAEGLKIIDASKKFDQGELSMEQFKQIELQADDTIAALRAQHLLNHVQTLPQKGGEIGIADAHVLEQHLEKMTVEHPWSAELNDQEIDWLSAVARDEFRGRGQPIQPNSPGDTLRLRQRVAELTDIFGPAWYPGRDVVAPKIQAQQTPPAQGNQTGNTRPAAGNGRVRENARLASVAANQPPSLNNAGHADTGEASVTTDKVEAMTEDEILALPRAVRDRYLTG